uniref:Uncharacterized protein n=1 Tax=Setaria italica TaxID=4555 RepID=K4A068_SETIT
ISQATRIINELRPLHASLGTANAVFLHHPKKRVQLNQVHCMNQLRWKQFLSAAKSQRSRSLVGCSSSDSSAEVAALSRPADFSTAQSDQSMTRCVDLVPGALIIISGYWIGPDVDDGCGSVEAMLQRIV